MIFKSTKPKFKHYNIPPTDENHELLRKAKVAIAASHPDQALELLSTLKLKTLDIEITALSARLADLERTQRFGTESYDTETREHNKINKSIILLITALETEIAQSFEFYDKIRGALKTRYENRLNQKLSNRQPVNLRLVPSTTGTTPQAANTFVQYSEGQIRGKLAEYYKDANGRLLLVGVPGAGKTTLLLQLELELLEKEITRIPVILNLARWSSEFPTLEAWIQEILPSEMGLTINKKIAADLVEQDRLILLLDGLDEIKEENRQVCLEAIGIYGEDPDRHFIISSRIEEYKAAAKDAPVNSQVEVGTLKYEQLIEQLEKSDANEGSQRLLAALKEDKLLREIAEIPFYFNALQLLFARGKYLHEFNFSAQNIEGRKKELEQSFVSEMFRRFTTKDYDVQLANKYLRFFASRLKRKNLVDFELIHLQYDWVKISKFVKLMGNILEGIVKNLFSILLVALIGTIYGVFNGDIIGSFFIVMINAPMIIVVKSIEKKTYPIIYAKENLLWNFDILSAFKKEIKDLWKILMSSLQLGFFIGLILSFFKGLGEGLVLGLVVGLFFGLFMGFWSFIINLTSNLGEFFATNYSSLLQINSYYQRFISSSKRLHFSLVQYWHLLFILYKKGLLPFKLVFFLNDMVACHILETTGASWRFRHRILQDYFADQWVETEFEPERK